MDAPNLHLVTEAMKNPSVTDFFGGDKAAIEPKRCIDCGLCQSHCRFQAINREEGRYQINEYACEGCGVCAYVCPEEAIVLRTDVAGTKKLYTGDGVFSTAALKMGRGNLGKLVTEVKMAMLKNAPDTQLAIIDGSPGIGCPVIASIGGMDLVLIVAEPSLSGFSDLKRLVENSTDFSDKAGRLCEQVGHKLEYTAAIQAFCDAGKYPVCRKIAV